jgi:hypothetical protein
MESSPLALQSWLASGRHLDIVHAAARTKRADGLVFRAAVLRSTGYWSSLNLDHPFAADGAAEAGVAISTVMVSICTSAEIFS